jgi:hypothetical protein
MINNILKDKPTKLFLGFTAFFVANALIAECIGLMNYIYKCIMAIIRTPVIITVEKRIEKYFGHATAVEMKKMAVGKSSDGFKNIPTAG